MTASEIKENFSDIFNSGISRNNFVRELYKNGVDFQEMDYLENSIEFTVIDKYSNGENTKKRLHNREINESDINNKFYPFCTEIFLDKKEIHVIPCEYNSNGYRITPLVKIHKI